jgi:hypothetical protein
MTVRATFQGQGNWVASPTIGAPVVGAGQDGFFLVF